MANYGLTVFTFDLPLRGRGGRWNLEFWLLTLNGGREGRPFIISDSAYTGTLIKILRGECRHWFGLLVEGRGGASKQGNFYWDVLGGEVWLGNMFEDEMREIRKCRTPCVRLRHHLRLLPRHDVRRHSSPPRQLSSRDIRGPYFVINQSSHWPPEMCTHLPTNVTVLCALPHRG